MVAFLIPMLLGAAKGAGMAEVGAQAQGLDAADAADAVGQGASSGAASGAIAGTVSAPTETAAVQGPSATADAVSSAAQQGPTATGATVDSSLSGGTTPAGGTDWFKLAMKLVSGKKQAEQQFNANPLNRILANLGLVDRPATPWLGGTQGPLTPDQEQARMMADLIAPSSGPKGLLGTGISAVRGLFQ